MEVMNVPQSRSRISIAPSMVKGKRPMGGKRGMRNPPPMEEGEGFMDVLKSVGKVVAPIAIDLASDYAKKRLSGGMALPINMTPAQKRTLKKGGAITIKPEMISDVAQQALAMLPASAKKVLGSLSKNKGVRFALKQGEDLIDRTTGKGLFDVLKSVGKVVAPIAIDLASKEAKRRVSGEGIFDVLKSVGKAVAPVAIDLASDYAKKRVSGGRMRKVPMSKGCGSPYVSAPYKQVMDLSLTENGGGINPAGSYGGGIYPAGRYGGMVGMPIQQGSPYASMDSPAMRPFMPTRGIQSYDPIGKKEGRGKFGSIVGSLLGNFLPF
jgi:hypothetical protein